MSRSSSENRTRWTADEAGGELEAWRRSGEPLAAFARRRGYHAQRLAWWEKRLGEAPSPAGPLGRAAGRARKASPMAGLALAPAVITGGRRAAVVVQIEADGVRLDVDDPAAVDPAWLAAVATALREGAAR